MIDHFTLGSPLHVGDIELLPFNQLQSSLTMDGADLELFLGKTVARAVTLASTSKEAIAQAEPIIDDALTVLRIALDVNKIAPEEERLQRRGSSFLTRRTSTPAAVMVYWRRGRAPYTFEVDQGIRADLAERIRELKAGYSVATESLVRDAMLRALHWIGSSILRDDHDDKIVDLCTALECVFVAHGDERQKAAYIASRYVLVGLAVERAWVTLHPLDVFLLYGVRNRIIHGEARRLSNKRTTKSLRFVALEAYKRMSLLSRAHPEADNLSALLAHAKTPSNLDQAIAFIEKVGTTQPKAVTDARATVLGTLKGMRADSGKPA
ncbi:MAG: HEPN domain-containing protein [Chloroflexota bacterium]|nr:HEPN domain-containing protein [Chloroflexota bacterium]